MPLHSSTSINGFFEGNNYEEVIINSISIGGDCDTVAAMAGGIAYAYYKEIPNHLLNHCIKRFDQPMLDVYSEFKAEYL